MSVKVLNANNFNEVINSSEVPVLVDFYADWCGPCKMLAPVLEEISKEESGVLVCKINIDENPEIASKFSVMSIPTLISFKQGKEAKRNVGAVPKPALLSLVK